MCMFIYINVYVCVCSPNYAFSYILTLSTLMLWLKCNRHGVLYEIVSSYLFPLIVLP